MKKLILFIVPVMLFSLTACNEDTQEEKTGQVVCTLSMNDVVNGYNIESEYKINYKGDFVESVDTVETVTSESQDIIDLFETTIQDTYSKTNEAYGGYDYEITKQEGKLISDVSIDYNVMDLEKYSNDQPVLKSYMKDGKMTVDGSKSIYEAMGATCK